MLCVLLWILLGIEEHTVVSKTRFELVFKEKFINQQSYDKKFFQLLIRKLFFDRESPNLVGCLSVELRTQLLSKRIRLEKTSKTRVD